jgi:hypothetical protein
VVEIERCTECAEFYDDSQDYLCRYSMGWRKIHRPQQIPDWCPLPEAERLRKAESGLREAVELLRQTLELKRAGDVLDWDLWHMKAEDLVDRLGEEVSE